MTELAAGWVVLLADWSLRWGVLILGLMLLFAVRPPRAVAARLWLARLVLVGGLVLPLSPHWWAVTWPRPTEPPPVPPVAEAVPPPEVERPVGQGVHYYPPPPAAGPDLPPDTARLPVADSPPVPVPDEPRPTPRESINWPVVLAAEWAIGCGLLLLRLVAGRWWLARVRRAAVPVGGELLRELEAVRDDLGVRRRVALLASVAVAGPALFGGRRPAVVVPSDWAELPAADRRAALLHELTHVAHADDWAALAEELVRTVFFFHPLVHWLLARLAREREQVCDAAAVRRGVAPRDLARVLFDVARRVGPGRSVLAGPAIPMAHRSTVAVRIHHLLEADMTRWSEPLSKARAARAAVAVLAVCAALGGFGATATPAPPADPPQAPPKAAEAVKAIRGSVKDGRGEAVAGATVIAMTDVGQGKRLTATTGADGRFSFDNVPSAATAFPNVLVIAVKEGFAPADGYAALQGNRETVLTLPDAGDYGGTVKDSAGRPVRGAELQVGFVRRSGGAASWGYQPENALRGTPAERFYFTPTDEAGRFRFTTVPAGAELILRVRAKGLAELDTGAGGPGERAHVAKPGAKPAELVLQPEAVVRGRVVSRVPAVKPEAVEVQLQGTNALHGFRRTVRPAADGTFTAAGLPAGPIALSLVLPADTPGTAAGAKVTTKAGATDDVSLEVIPGVVVSGRVWIQGTEEPVAGVQMATVGLVNPDGFGFGVKPTDADGKFTLRLPPGKVTVMVWTRPSGYGQREGRRREIEVPTGAEAFAIPEPFELIRVVEGLTGRVTDAAGKPLPHAKVSALQHSSVCGNFATEPVTASFDGGFTLRYSPNGPLEAGRSVPLRVETPDGRRFEAAALVPKDGVAVVRVPTLPDVAGPQDVKSNELAGVVVDEKGKPLAGVKVHVWDWVDRPEHYTFTGPDGVFRIKGNDPKRHVQVRFKKDGFSPVMVVRQPVGVKGLVVAMDRATYFEGVVRGPDVKPAAGAVIRADQGPKMMDGGMYTQVWTEATADAQGKYRLYVQPDEYAFHVKAAGVGVARLPKTGIAHGQARTFDIPLQPGVTFRARVIDSVTGKPVAGFRLFDWQEKSVDGRSDANGEVTITDMVPGTFEFSIDSETHAQWRTDGSPGEGEPTGERRWNYHGLRFDLKPGMAAVTITADPAVRVTGKVLDPDGKPVGGATVAPARTGTGNSLTGDTRFSVETKADGTFVMTLPASGAAEYNLVAHDGKYGEWRTWANGVLPPVKTTPGQVIENVTLSLTRPAVVRGKVVDADGKPVAGREVRAEPTDRRENRYYDPTTTTKADGTFELKFVRPAEQWIQAAPFWLDAKQSPADSTRTLTLVPGQVVEGVTLVAAEEREK